MRIAIFGISTFMLLCGAAVARPRDEVMINVYRCASHPATRTWLDCYYGAAQPQRAALGLPPAPSAQAALVTAPAAPGVPQDLGVRDAVIAAAARCGSVAAERPWLDCYYAAANPVRARLGLSLVPGGVPVPQPASLPAPLPAKARRDTSLLEDLLGTRDVAVAGRMSAYSFNRNGLFTITLDNGQVWRQLDGDGHVAHWTRPAHSYAVTIINGAVGSFSLSVKGQAGSYKVRRIS